MWKVHGMRDYRHGNLAYLSISGVPFRDFKEGNIYYVDKTMLIADILGDRSRNVYIYVRPRRFGKSTNLSMLDAFFNLKYEGNDCFDGLEKSKHHEFDGHRNTHPVIRMNLKDPRAVPDRCDDAGREASVRVAGPEQRPPVIAREFSEDAQRDPLPHI